MSRYIDADAFDDTVQTLNEQGWNITRFDYKRMDRVLFEMPTADVVEVVRCKDCKHFHDGIYNGEYWMECDEYRIALSSDDWFCADGKRREDDTQN